MKEILIPRMKEMKKTLVLTMRKMKKMLILTSFAAAAAVYGTSLANGHVPVAAASLAWMAFVLLANAVPGKRKGRRHCNGKTATSCKLESKQSNYNTKVINFKGAAK